MNHTHSQKLNPLTNHRSLPIDATTMSDILYEQIPLPAAAVNSQLRHFGLSEEQLVTLLQVSTLAGGAAANIFYNYLNSANPKPMDSHSDLDFWIHDPHIDKLRHETRDRLYELFNETLRNAGYISYREDLHRQVGIHGSPINYHYTPCIADHQRFAYQRAFAVQGATRIICNWWAKEDPETGATKRIQLIFTSRLIADTLMDFDFAVCRAALSCRSHGTYQLQWSGQCEKVMRDRLMFLHYMPTHEPDQKNKRLWKYAKRYNIKIFCPDGSPFTPNIMDE